MAIIGIIKYEILAENIYDNPMQNKDTIVIIKYDIFFFIFKSSLLSMWNQENLV